jgi:hypothetical protein
MLLREFSLAKKVRDKNTKTLPPLFLLYSNETWEMEEEKNKRPLRR